MQQTDGRGQIVEKGDEAGMLFSSNISHSGEQIAPPAVAAEREYFEPRWDSQGNRIVGIPVKFLLGDYSYHSARFCGNLPECYACHRTIFRDEMYYSVRAEYTKPQSTGDVVADYACGGVIHAAQAAICEKCWGEINAD